MRDSAGPGWRHTVARGAVVRGEDQDKLSLDPQKQWGLTTAQGPCTAATAVEAALAVSAHGEEVTVELGETFQNQS